MRFHQAAHVSDDFTALSARKCRRQNVGVGQEEERLRIFGAEVRRPQERPEGGSVLAAHIECDSEPDPHRGRAGVLLDPRWNTSLLQVEQQVDKAEVQEHWHDGSPVLARKEVGLAGRSESEQDVTVCRTSRHGHENKNHRCDSEGRGCAHGKTDTLQFFKQGGYPNSSASVPVLRG
jgi:hypothetical protein